MPTDREIYISANLVIKQHGEEALEHSMIMLTRMVEAGDRSGGVVWGRIQRAIIELQNMEPGTVN